MRLGVLGPLLLETDNGLAVSLGRGQRTLLAALALDRRRVWTTDELADAVWGDEAPPTASRLIRNRVSELRTRHGGGLIDTVGAGYRLGGAVVLDVDPSRGTPFVDLSDWPPARPLIEMFWANLRNVEEHATAADLAAGRYVDALGRAERLLLAEPYRERCWALRAHARYGSNGQAALAECERARDVQREDLGLDPGPELHAMEQRVLRQDPSLTGIVRRTPPPWPSSRLVARTDDIERLTRTMAEHRLVTIVGLGGIGKTRLAIEVACADPDAVFVDLAGVSDADVLEAVLRTAGVPGTHDPMMALRAWATNAGGVVVMDNAEGVVSAVGPLANEIVNGGARVHVLVTSQVPLGVAGEQLVVLGPLTPDGALELFAARAVRRHDRETVAGVCEALERLPLAIELAASLAEVVDLGEVLVSDALRAIADVIRWSLDAISRAARALLTGATTLPSPFSVDAAEHLHGEPGVASVVAELVRHSLLVTEFGPRTRYRMLDLVREATVATGERAGPTARRRVVEWAVATAESIEHDHAHLHIGDIPNLSCGAHVGDGARRCRCRIADLLRLPGSGLARAHRTVPVGRSDPQHDGRRRSPDVRPRCREPRPLVPHARPVRGRRSPCARRDRR